MKKALKSVFRKGEANVVKILCLGVGLAIGLTLLAEVIFQRSYDNFIPRLEDTYRVGERYMRPSDGGLKEYTQVSGAVAPGLKAYCPEVEAATRFTKFTADAFVSEDKKEVLCNIYMCDSSFFDVFPLPILMGEPPRTGLEKAGCGYISRACRNRPPPPGEGALAVHRAFRDISPQNRAGLPSRSCKSHRS